MLLLTSFILGENHYLIQQTVNAFGQQTFVFNRIEEEIL